ncbi:DUF3394 domain-containing protein [Virgibacillus kimchii]
MLIGSAPEIILAVITAVIGIVGISNAAEGWMFRHTLWYERLTLIIGALLMIAPGLWTDIVGVVILAAVYVLQRFTRKDLLPE